MKKVMIIIISVVVGLFILIRIPINLQSNAYYYATHMPHKGDQYPFVSLLNGHYLPKNYVLGYEVQNLNSSVREPDIMWVSKKNLERKGDLLRLTHYSISYELNENDSWPKEYKIYFKDNGNYNGKNKSKNMPSYSGKLILSNLNNIQNEIKKNASKPKVNLQWIWNVWFKIHYR
ncbi:hypothetical protein H5S11_10610 [Limosilactobacillus sp. pH52_RY]|uniref:hypothetical protein n=1 Tax=Limosilactobacillus balticus TaxID=2759747 RepID=UPI0015FC2F56|nr:hypothetical protein [Limosilactobacillus balticus]MBB1110881.1 hypothetical protein [Limosilactobacillus balticus]